MRSSVCLLYFVFAESPADSRAAYLCTLTNTSCVAESDRLRPSQPLSLISALIENQQQQDAGSIQTSMHKKSSSKLQINLKNNPK